MLDKGLLTVAVTGTKSTAFKEYFKSYSK